MWRILEYRLSPNLLNFWKNCRVLFQVLVEIRQRRAALCRKGILNACVSKLSDSGSRNEFYVDRFSLRIVCGKAIRDFHGGGADRPGGEIADPDRQPANAHATADAS